MFYVLSKSFAGWLVTKKHWRKSWVAILVIIISFFIILLPMSVMVTLLYNKVATVVENPQSVVKLVKSLDSYVMQKFHYKIISDKTISSVQTYASVLLSTVINQGLNFFSTIAMMYFFLYFFIVNINRLEAAIIFYLPFSRSKIIMFGNELVAQTFSNAVGIPAIALGQGLCGFICYWIAGVSEPGFWAVITGFASIVPVLGTALVWAPVCIYLLIAGATWQGIFVGLWGLLVLGSVDNIIRFALAKKMADVHPIVTVLGVIIGLNYFGITGLIFGPLIISYFIILLRIYYVEYQKPVPVKPNTKPVVPSYFQLPFLGKFKNKKQ